METKLKEMFLSGLKKSSLGNHIAENNVDVANVDDDANNLHAQSIFIDLGDAKETLKALRKLGKGKKDGETVTFDLELDGDDKSDVCFVEVTVKPGSCLMLLDAWDTHFKSEGLDAEHIGINLGESVYNLIQKVRH